MELTPQNATITTATVEVKALTVGGKQVTLAVFRQLPPRRLVGEYGALQGQPWGRVNYHPDKTCQFGGEGHLHVVWQWRAELFRDVVRASHFYADAAESDHSWIDGWTRICKLPQLFIAV